MDHHPRRAGTDFGILGMFFWPPTAWKSIHWWYCKNSCCKERAFSPHFNIFVKFKCIYRPPSAVINIWWHLTLFETKKNANHRLTLCQEEMRQTGKTKRDKKGEKWRMKMKENFPSWPGKLHRIGNRCPTTVTLSEKTLKVLLVWGEGGSKNLKSAAAHRRDPEGNPLCWGMCGGKEWESVLERGTVGIWGFDQRGLQKRQQHQLISEEQNPDSRTGKLDFSAWVPDCNN